MHYIKFHSLAQALIFSMQRQQFLLLYGLSYLSIFPFYPEWVYAFAGKCGLTLIDHRLKLIDDVLGLIRSHAILNQELPPEDSSWLLNNEIFLAFSH
ncbi:hypothetical protein ADS46_12250 [Halomonas sp. G11]|nr:hypothetical protein ADS46_12250 [Halomonas sp. G11]